MPVDMKEVMNGTGVVITGYGNVSEKEYLDVMRTYLNREREDFAAYRFCLADWENVNKTDISNNAIASIADLSKRAAQINSQIITASVAGKDLIFGLTRMAHILRDQSGGENRVFRVRSDAENWIKQKMKDKYDLDDLFFE